MITTAYSERATRTTGRGDAKRGSRPCGDFSRPRITRRLKGRFDKCESWNVVLWMRHESGLEKYHWDKQINTSMYMNLHRIQCLVMTPINLISYYNFFNSFILVTGLGSQTSYIFSFRNMWGNLIHSVDWDHRPWLRSASRWLCRPQRWASNLLTSQILLK